MSRRAFTAPSVMLTETTTTTDTAPDTSAQVSGFTARLLTYGEESSPDVFGDVVVFEPGSLWLPATTNVPLIRNHNDDLAASAVLMDIEERAGGEVFATFQLLPTLAGVETSTELAAGVRTDVSIGVFLEEYTSTELEDTDAPWSVFRHEVSRAELIEVSQVLRGRLPSAIITEIT